MAVAEAPTSDVAIARVEAFGGGHERGSARGAGAAGVGEAVGVAWHRSPLGGICMSGPGTRGQAMRRAKISSNNRGMSGFCVQQGKGQSCVNKGCGGGGRD